MNTIDPLIAEAPAVPPAARPAVTQEFGAQPKRKETLWSVFDDNAREIAPDGRTPMRRRHEPIPGKVYDLSAFEPTQMAKSHAMKFLCDKKFKVYDEAGKLVNPIADVKTASANGGIILQPGQVVANVDELSDSALAARCAMTMGGHDIAEHGTREEMVDWLLSEPDRKRARTGDDAVSERLKQAQVELTDTSFLDRVMPKPDMRNLSV